MGPVVCDARGDVPIALRGAEERDTEPRPVKERYACLLCVHVYMQPRCIPSRQGTTAHGQSGEKGAMSTETHLVGHSGRCCRPEGERARDVPMVPPAQDTLEQTRA